MGIAGRLRPMNVSEVPLSFGVMAGSRATLRVDPRGPRLGAFMSRGWTPARAEITCSATSSLGAAEGSSSATQRLRNLV